jgi:hypothetical protein
MPLSVGDRLGPYEILAPIGAGDPGSVPRKLNVILNWSGELDRGTPR